MNFANSPDALHPLVDFDQLRAACDGDAVLMRELLNLYFQQASEIMSGLDQAIKAGAIPDVNHLAHKLAGSSLACGMAAAVAPARALEHGAKAGHLQNAAAIYTDACQQIEAMRQQVENYLRENPIE